MARRRAIVPACPAAPGWQLQERLDALLTGLADQRDEALPRGAPVLLGEALRHVEQFKANTLRQRLKADGHAGAGRNKWTL